MMECWVFFKYREKCTHNGDLMQGDELISSSILNQSASRIKRKIEVAGLSY